MNIKFTKIVFFLIFYSASSVAFSMPSDCHRIGGKMQVVCDVSFLNLISNSSLYNDKYIRLTGYLADGAHLLIFNDKSSFLHSVTSNSLQVVIENNNRLNNKLLRLNHSTVIIIGKYSSSGLNTSRVSGYKTAGTIRVQSVGPAAGPWGYTPTDSSILNSLSTKR